MHSSEPVSFTVRAADLRPHPAGRQLDLLAEVTVGDEPVWQGRSSYLRREKSVVVGVGAAERAASCPSRRVWSRGSACLGDTGRRYAAVSGDRNPIHLHPLAARAFGFSSAIAHGMWLKARTLAALSGQAAGRVHGGRRVQAPGAAAGDGRDRRRDSPLRRTGISTCATRARESRTSSGPSPPTDSGSRAFPVRGRRVRPDRRPPTGKAARPGARVQERRRGRAPADRKRGQRRKMPRR